MPWRWDDNDANFVLDQNAQLDFYRSTSLKQQFTSVASLWHIIPIIILLNTMFLAEKQQMPIL